MVIDVPEGTTWLKGNIEVNGYYIVNYDNTTWREIIQQLKTNSTVSNYKVYQSLSIPHIITNWHS